MADPTEPTDPLPPVEPPDPVYTSVIIPPGASLDQATEVFIEAWRNSAGWAGDVSSEERHLMVIYGAAAVTLEGVALKFFPAPPDNVGPIEPEPEPTDPIPPPEPPPDKPPDDPIIEFDDLPRGRVTAKALNVRATPTVTSTNKVGTLPNGETVFILEASNTFWHKIVFDIPAGYAWVSKKYIALE